MSILSQSDPFGNSSTWADQVQVTDWKPIKNGGNLRAMATVRIGPLTVHGVRVIQQPGQKAWISLPQRQDESGRYFPVITTDDDHLKNTIRDKVLAMYGDSVMFGLGGAQ